MDRPPEPAGPPGEPPRWGYGARDGPACWGSLDPAFALCARGREQSPIDLAGGRPADLAPVGFDYRRVGVSVENTGHTVQVNPEPGSSILLDRVRYALAQFHFHHGSEHLVDGVRLPLELHLVHASADGALAVVGVLIEEGAANEALAPVWACLPAEPGPPRAVPGTLDLASLIPAGGTAWRYRGSLTTPPCSEGVAWAIPTGFLTMSAAQIAAFGAIFPRNYRPVQPLGERVLRIG